MRTHLPTDGAMFPAIIETISTDYEIPADLLLGDRGTARVAFARQLVMVLAKRHTGLSSAEIASRLGNRDAGTVRHAVKVVKEKEKHSEPLAAYLKAVCEWLNIQQANQCTP